MNGLIIFIKNPVLGKAKTRIAKDSSDEIALDIYLKLLSYTQSVAQEVPVSRYVFYSEYIGTQDIWSPTHFKKYVQEGDSLGERMSNAFKNLQYRHKKLLLIGSDCTQLTAGNILEAYQILERKDVVLGPTLDGGYYLVGMKRFIPKIFMQIKWSTPTVLMDTISIIENEGLSYGLLPTYSDIDYLSDWQKYKVE